MYKVTFITRHRRPAVFGPIIVKGPHVEIVDEATEADARHYVKVCNSGAEILAVEAVAR
jgi:hypothetical protein